MEAIQRLQALDFVLVILWATIVGWGVRSGVLRQLVMLLGAYIGLIAAGQLYRPVGGLLTMFGPGANARPQLEWLAYPLMFFIALAIVSLGAWRAYPNTQLLDQRRLDRVLGGIVGGVWGALLLITLMVVLRFYTLTFWPGQELTQGAVTLQVERAQLAPVLQLGLSPLWQAATPWFPDPLRPLS